MQKRIKFACQSKKNKKLKFIYYTYPEHIRHGILKGALVGILPECPVGPWACSFSSAAHLNHAGVQQLTKGPQLRVDTHAVPLAIPVDVLPPPLTNWMDHRPILPSPSRWSQERASQPTKIELVTSYKN
jgi:hypothetical protein